MEGLAQSLISMVGLSCDVPDYSTLSIKLRDMKIKLPPVWRSVREQTMKCHLYFRQEIS